MTGSDLFAHRRALRRPDGAGLGLAYARAPGPIHRRCSSSHSPPPRRARPFAWVRGEHRSVHVAARRAGIAIVAGAAVATVAVEAWFWLAATSMRTPLYLISKLAGLLGVRASSWRSSRRSPVDGLGARPARRLDRTLVARPVDRARLPAHGCQRRRPRGAGWEIANWQAAGYVEVAVPALVASVAMHAARTTPETRRDEVSARFSRSCSRASRRF